MADLKAALGKALVAVAGEQTHAADEAARAAAAQELHARVMNTRCDAVAEIVSPLLNRESFLNESIACAIRKNQEAATRNYPVTLPPRSPNTFSSTVIQNYLGQSRGVLPWRALTEATGSFVLFRHSVAPGEDSDVKIILGLTKIEQGERIDHNFVTRRESTLPAVEIDIVVNAGDEPSYQIRYSPAEQLEIAQQRGGPVSMQTGAKLSAKMTEQDLAVEIYTRIIKGLGIDARVMQDLLVSKQIKTSPPRELPGPPGQ